MKTIETLSLNQDEFENILKRHKVQKISLFGSFMRNKSHESSDIDFLVEFEKTADLLDMVGLKLELEEFLKRKTDIVTPNSLSKYIREKIIKEAIPIYG